MTQILDTSGLAAAKLMVSQSKFLSDYSRWRDDLNRKETWEEAVRRVMDMHREKYAHCMNQRLEDAINFVEEMYRQQVILGAQRALQYGGAQIFKHEGRLYNCSSSHVDRLSFFQECMYLLLCGCGVGFSVQKQHIAQLPDMAPRQNHGSVFVVPDSIEGWADAFGVLISSYFTGEVPFPEYQNQHVSFDLSQIRPKGAYISGGFKAPGPEPLRNALQRCEALLDKHLAYSRRMSPILAYDFTMHMADAVLAGGVRRSATICLFSKDDHDMLRAKTGDWFTTNPQRGRSNNSVMLLRNQLNRDEWHEIIKSVKDYGEPGFIFTDNLEFAYNPCVEIGMLPKTQDGRSGFQMCNLSEINGGYCSDRQKFLRACKAAAIIGTLQAGYTKFPYLGAATEEIVAREALIGVSITGWMNNPAVLFDQQNMIDGALEVRKVNREIAELIGIRPAARTTCVKPSGNASVLLGTASGIHGEHAMRYFRHVQMNEDNQVLQLLADTNPAMIEDSVWNNNGTDKVVAFPIEACPGSFFKSSLMGVKQLEYVKLAQQYWVEYGTNQELCTNPGIRHNVSNTITVDDWDMVEEYLYDNRRWFAGVSLLSARGDKAYAQAPFTEVLTKNAIVLKYGDASLFASGLIVDGLYAFDNNLWLACDTAMGTGKKLHPTHSQDLLKRDWVRRAHGFAANYFDGDLNQMTDCLKDVFNFHKWKTIERQIVPVNLALSITEQTYTDVNTMGAQACAGGVCELP